MEPRNVNQNNNKLVSVVIPVYKVEQYLDRCVNSIIEQTYENLQIILVDDGSPDKCPELCDEWAKKNSKIEVIHKSNEGLGLARNDGLRIAKGKYVCFIDSDDYIHKTTIEKLYNRIEETKSDACYYGCVDVIEGKESEKEKPNKLFFEGDEIRTEFAPNLIGNEPNIDVSTFTGMSACFAFYKTEFLRNNSITFNSEREQYISEDLIFNLNVYEKAERIAILPESLYYYVIRKSDSLRSTYRADRFEKSKKMYLKLIEFSDKFNLGKAGEIRAQKYLLQATIACVKMELLTPKTKKQIYASLKTYINDSLLFEIIMQYPIKLLPWKQKLFALCLKYKSASGMYLLAYLQNRRLKSFI